MTRQGVCLMKVHRWPETIRKNVYVKGYRSDPRMVRLRWTNVQEVQKKVTKKGKKHAREGICVEGKKTGDKAARNDATTVLFTLLCLMAIFHSTLRSLPDGPFRLRRCFLFINIFGPFIRMASSTIWSCTYAQHGLPASDISLMAVCLPPAFLTTRLTANHSL